ncbi:type VI secretion system accessory protein TagJ [Pirellulaceae bacterium SH467]
MEDEPLGENMSALQFLKAGDLAKAQSALQDEVRNNPSDSKLRVFLFQLYSILGQSEKALNQLNVLRDLSKDAMTLVQTYQEALQCDSLRENVFEGKRTPLVFGQPEEWIAMMINALSMGSNPAAASELRSLALERASAVAGVITFYPKQQPKDASATSDGEKKETKESFAWIADADSRIGPVFEAIIHGKYYWVPAGCVRAVTLEKVTDLRDLVWLPAKFEWTNGGEAVAFIPTRYPKSSQHADDSVKLARTTQWTEVDENTYCGVGLRILATDQGEYALTDIARIEFQQPETDLHASRG